MSASPPDPIEVLQGQLDVPSTPALDDSQLPKVAIIILNWNGRHHLAGCFESLSALDYPASLVRVHLIDNGSDDGSVELIRREHANIELHQNDRNLGFSRGCNQGSELAADADVLVFLNNDMRVDASFLRRLVGPIASGQCEATTAKMLSWDGQRINSAGGGMNFHGIGIQRGYEEVPGEDYDQARLSLFACGGAMAMDADVFREVGRFDEEFFAYYEDVDLGWRTWVMGYSIRYVPEAVCYHHHSSTSNRVPTERLRVLQVRNPLLACFKNYDDANLARVLPSMLALATRRCYLASGLGDAPDYRIEGMRSLPSDSWLGRGWRAVKKRLGGQPGIPPVAVADLVAINDLIGRWKHWSERRAAVQAKRRRSDEEILRLFLHPMWCIEQESGYRDLHEGLAKFAGLERLFAGLTHLEHEPRN
jgi:GT2 family glycosyltransferase